MIVYANFEVSLHGLNITSQDQLTRLRVELFKAVEEVANRRAYKDPDRLRMALVSDIVVDLVETAGEL